MFRLNEVQLIELMRLVCSPVDSEVHDDWYAFIVNER